MVALIVMLRPNINRLLKWCLSVVDNMPIIDPRPLLLPLQAWGPGNHRLRPIQRAHRPRGQRRVPAHSGLPRRVCAWVPLGPGSGVRGYGAVGPGGAKLGGVPEATTTNSPYASRA